MSESNVVILPVVTKLDIPVERVLNAAAEAGLTNCVVIGETEDGGEYFCSSWASGGDVVWALERAKLQLLRTADGDQS